MTTMIITIVLFMIMLLMGFPVAYAMGIAGMWGLLDFGTVSDVMAAQKCFSTMNFLYTDGSSVLYSGRRADEYRRNYP